MFKRFFRDTAEVFRRIPCEGVNVVESLSFRDFLGLGNNQSHKKPCQGGRLVAEPQKCHDFL
jgi:hypothetical protein